MGEKAPGSARLDRGELMVLYALGVIVLVGLALLWVRQQGWFGAPVVVHAPEKRLDRPIEINAARQEDLMQVRGIGEARAREIIFRRDALLRNQRARRVKTLGYRNVDEFMTDIDNITGLTSDIKNELRGAVRVVPTGK